MKTKMTFTAIDRLVGALFVLCGLRLAMDGYDAAPWLSALAGMSAAIVGALFLGLSFAGAVLLFGAVSPEQEHELREHDAPCVFVPGWVAFVWLAVCFAAAWFLEGRGAFAATILVFASVDFLTGRRSAILLAERGESRVTREPR